MRGNPSPPEPEPEPERHTGGGGEAERRGAGARAGSNPNASLNPCPYPHPNPNPNPSPNPNPYQARAVRCGHRAVRVQGGLGGRQLCAAGVRQAPSRLPQRGHLPRRDVLLPLWLHGRRLRPAALPPRVLRPRRVRPRRRVHLPVWLGRGRLRRAVVPPRHRRRALLEQGRLPTRPQCGAWRAPGIHVPLPYTPAHTPTPNP